jgi:hypothetical protein
VSVSPGDCNHPLGSGCTAKERIGFRYEATGDEGPDMARKRRWPVEHVVYQRLELLKDEERKNLAPR